MANHALHPAVWRAIFDTAPNPKYQASDSEISSLIKLINLLDKSPSLRRKTISTQIRAMCQSRHASDPKRSSTTSTNLMPDRLSCFTIDQAVAFLDVDRDILVSNYSPAIVRNARRSVKRNLYQLVFQAIPPDVPARTECRWDVFTIKDVLRAAHATHSKFSKCLSFVQRAVRTDNLRFDRAQRAARTVDAIAAEKHVQTREVEYALNASVEVTDFRQGLWDLTFDEYRQKVCEMISVHVGLGGCYQCLLICDGNARLKAKRIVGKILRKAEGYDVCQIVKTLEGSLWWARSKSNVQKMEEMSRNMPKIRV